jgi:tetratricopeptide (TPR) repeat protein
MRRILEIQADLMGDDLPVGEHMCAWTDEQVVAYFESGGVEVPPSRPESVAPSWSEVQSSADARTVRSLEDAREQAVGDDAMSDEVGAELGGAGRGAGIDGDGDVLDGDLEDALLDDLMASVPVTGRTPPPAPVASSAPSASGLDAWSVKQLKAALQQAGVDPSGFSEKRELVAAVACMPGGGAAGSATGAGSELGAPTRAGTSGDGVNGGAGSSGGGVAAAAAGPTDKGRRLRVKADDIKKSGDRCFGDHDYAKAEAKYTKCIELLSDVSVAAEAAVRELRGSLLSNRSACRAHLSRYDAALADGRAALEARPGWARGFSRVGFALFSLRRYDEARRAYEEGLALNIGNTELERGLAAVFKQMGGTAGASPAAAEAKAAGNRHFAAGEDELALAAYTRAIQLAPHDEALYSNRSASNSRLGRCRSRK